MAMLAKNVRRKTEGENENEKQKKIIRTKHDFIIRALICRIINFRKRAGTSQYGLSNAITASATNTTITAPSVTTPVAATITTVIPNTTTTVAPSSTTSNPLSRSRSILAASA
jgi:hypothetical protein